MVVSCGESNKANQAYLNGYDLLSNTYRIRIPKLNEMFWTQDFRKVNRRNLKLVSCMEEPKPYLSRLRWQRDLCLSPRYYRVKDLSIGTLAGYNPRFSCRLGTIDIASSRRFAGHPPFMKTIYMNSWDVTLHAATEGGVEADSSAHCSQHGITRASSSLNFMHSC